MSEFFIQEKQLSRATRTIVKNEDGQSLFLMVGRWGTKGDALSLYSMNGKLVAHIKQISLTFGTRFELYKDFEKVGTMQKRFLIGQVIFIIFVTFIGQFKGIFTITVTTSIISISRLWR